MSLRERAMRLGKKPTFSSQSSMKIFLSELMVKVAHPTETKRTIPAPKPKKAFVSQEELKP